MALCYGSPLRLMHTLSKWLLTPSSLSRGEGQCSWFLLKLASTQHGHEHRSPTRQATECGSQWRPAWLVPLRDWGPRTKPYVCVLNYTEVINRIFSFQKWTKLKCSQTAPHTGAKAPYQYLCFRPTMLSCTNGVKQTLTATAESGCLPRQPSHYRKGEEILERTGRRDGSLSQNILSKKRHPGDENVNSSQQPGDE